MRKDLETELRTLEALIGIYCRGRHGGRKLCASCAGLLVYARARLDACPHRPKPACRDCATHCYAPPERALVREVMRYAGPRLALRRPLLALRHYLRRRAV
ncbi:MAG: nitrous oxide-stimulated promoter family protein [Elusimicrobiales bacterium]